MGFRNGNHNLASRSFNFSVLDSVKLQKKIPLKGKTGISRGIRLNTGFLDNEQAHPKRITIPIPPIHSFFNLLIAIHNL